MYDNLTLEEAIEKLNERDTQIETLQSAVDEASRAGTTSEAEINSLKAEIEELKKTSSAQSEELKKTKELNFTLGRQVANVNSSLSIEESLHSMFGEKERK